MFGMRPGSARIPLFPASVDALAARDALVEGDT
jgi:hypothetical protein